MSKCRWSLSAVGFVCLAVSPVAEAGPPVAVAPGSAAGSTVVASRCPTFHWGGVGGARAYELVVFRLPEAGGESAEQDALAPEAALRLSLPGSAQGWTPGLDQCFEAGASYAWSLRALGGEGSGEWGAWSEAALFEVARAPAAEEVEAALATLRRYLETGGGSAGAPSRRPRRELAAAEGAPNAASRLRAEGRAREMGTRVEPPAGGSTELTNLTQADVPALGSPSLTVSASVALGAASNFFKDGSVFLWDDTSGNTALGRSALASATGTATNNTASGIYALRDNTTGGGNAAFGHRALRKNTTGFSNTANGGFALYDNTTGFANTASGESALSNNTGGYYNTGSGYFALQSNTTGYRNTASGDFALRFNTTGSGNTASGSHALYFNTTGGRNVAIGYYAGYNAPGDAFDNVFIANLGNAGDAERTIRIGAQGIQSRTFIAGIRGVTTVVNDAVGVVIDSAGQLGTVSSSREVKQDIRDVAELSERLLELRPVAFRYREHAARDPETPLEFGLIAEEVAEVFPDLVVYDGDGKPEAVKYHLLSALLLNELKGQHAALEREREDTAAQGRELHALRERLARLEAVGPRDGARRNRRGLFSRRPRASP